MTAYYLPIRNNRYRVASSECNLGDTLILALPRMCALTLVLLSTCLAAIPFRANAQNAKPGLSSLPLAFESNEGQTTEPYRFLARRGSMKRFSSGMEWTLFFPDANRRPRKCKFDGAVRIRVRRWLAKNCWQRLERPRGHGLQVCAIGPEGGYLAALRRSLGVASQRSWPLGGTKRVSSTRATPAFFSEVM